MRLITASIATLLLSAALAGQETCGMPGVTVSLEPSCAAGFGQVITVTLTNNSAQTITLPSSCTFQSVHPTDCTSLPVFAPFCLSVLTPIAPGASASMSWNQTDNLGAQVPAGVYAFRVTYFDSSFSLFSCCPTIEVCTSPPALATETSRAGTPPNPSAFLPGVTSRPIVGAVWDPVIDHSSFMPTAVVDLVGVAFNPANLSLPPFGTLLCDAVTPPGIFLVVTNTNPGTPFAIPIPCQCDLIGLGVCTQGASVSSGGATVLLSNALDLTLGTF